MDFGQGWLSVDNLHLITLLALDAHTFEVFAALHMENRGKHLMWPLGVEINKSADFPESADLHSCAVD
jgi:hypothetical protein